MKLQTLLLVGLAVLAAAAAQAETRLYTIDSRNAEEIAKALGNVVRAQEACPPRMTSAGSVVQMSCHVELLPTGQIIVEAPGEVHAQIAAVLKAIEAQGAEPTPRITLRYWVISGVDEDKTARAPQPAGIEPVLAQLRRLHGNLTFAVEESASLTTESGTGATSNEGELEVQNTVFANGDTVRAEIRLDFRQDPGRACAQAQGGCQPFRQELGLTTTIRRGEYLVFGERAFDTPDGRGTMFYVVHWPAAE
jgi:hypothetical protein